MDPKKNEKFLELIEWWIIPDIQETSNLGLNLIWGCSILHSQTKSSNFSKNSNISLSPILKVPISAIMNEFFINKYNCYGLEPTKGDISDPISNKIIKLVKYLIIKNYLFNTTNPFLVFFQFKHQHTTQPKEIIIYKKERDIIIFIFKYGSFLLVL